jgi:CDP-paratose 2-epimerase
MARVPVAIITGSVGLVGGEGVRHFVERGFSVVGVDNNMRSYFFRASASTRCQSERLEALHGDSFRADPDWRPEYGVDKTWREIHEQSVDQWSASAIGAG